MNDVRALAEVLIARASITPEDAGCQALISERLRAANFVIENIDKGAVKNLWASHGSGSPVFVFLGHTDVVPTGPVSAWTSDPFTPTVRDGVLYGRGAADMKSSVSAFVCALEQFVKSFPEHPGTVALLLTSDEEGEAIDGVRHVAKIFSERGQGIDFCLVGEPSSANELGDVVRIGRRGSLTGNVTVHGVQGHVAYPEKAANPIHAALPVLLALSQRQWDSEAFPDFPRTSFQIANFNAGTGASNVIPGSATVQFNLRYSPRWNADALIIEIEKTFADAGVSVSIHWHRSGEPFHTQEGRLRAAVREALAVRGVHPDENTGGGTSDGRFIAPLGAEVVELGPGNASIHKVDEGIKLSELDALPDLYRDILVRCLGLSVGA